MAALIASPNTRVSFPARCAVAVICGEHLISQVYPASVPVEMFVDNVVELLNEELRRRGAPTLDPGVAYELNRCNGSRLDGGKTLDELGVEDGATLVLVPTSEGDSFEPQDEALSTGLARIGRKLFAPVTAETAANAAVVILASVTLTIVALSVRNRMQTDSLAAAVAAGAIGMLIAAGASAVWRWWPHRTPLLGGLCWIALPPLVVGLAAATPGAVGAPHVFIAALAAALLSCAVAVITQRQVTVSATVVTLCVIGGLVAAARMWRPIPAQWLGMGALMAALLLVTSGPTFALWAARLRPPHFGSITGRDLFRRSDGLPVDTVSPVDEDVDEESNPDTTPRGAVIAAAARRANGVLTGICVGAAIALPAAVWATVLPGGDRSTGAAVLAALFVVIFISRGRAFADRRQAVALVCGAAAAVCVGVVRYVVSQPAESTAALIWGATLLAMFAAAGLAAALLVPVTRFTPLVRMAAEWLELLAIVAAFPLAAWVGGLFAWVRMR